MFCFPGEWRKRPVLKKWHRNLWAMVAVLSLAACAYGGGQVNPLERKLSWYSYINGDDLRAVCQPGQPDTARLIYNAIYTEQIRTYDIAPTDDGAGGYAVEARVLGPASLSRLADGLLAPWTGERSRTHLRVQDMDRFWAAMDTSGVFDGGPSGLYLPSERFFWLVAACRAGVFYYNAYEWPSPAFEDLRFDDLLFAWDMTGIAVNPPREATSFDIYGDASPTRKTGAYYHVTVDENGLRGY